MNITYTPDSISFTCTKCGTPLEIKKRYDDVVLSMTFCPDCDEQYYTRWDGMLHRGEIQPQQEPLKLHRALINDFNHATDFGGPVPRSFAEDLLEQIRLRDILISDYRVLCNTEFVHVVHASDEDFLESWKQRRDALKHRADVVRFD